MKKILSLSALAALLALSACGGSSKINSSPPTTPTQPTTPPVSVADAFFAAVLRIVGDGSETSVEPQATDSIVATAPDNTEPAPLN